MINLYTLEEFDQVKTKVLKYILYKKRTEKEVKQKFSSSANQNLLEDIIEELKQNGYLSDENYVERAVHEFLAINTLSMKEIRNKLYAKGIESDIIDSYFSNNAEILENYEIECAKKLIHKKAQLESIENEQELQSKRKSQEQVGIDNKRKIEIINKEEIENYLYKKGYSSENIKTAFEQIEEE